MGERGGEEVETQFQSLEQELDALESQLMVLNEAKQAMRKGSFDSRTRTFDLLDWDQGMTGSIGIYGDNTGLGYQIPWFLDYSLGQSELETICAYEQNFAVALPVPNPFDLGSNGVESIAAEWNDNGGVPVAQALKILDWCRKTIERIATTLTLDQIE